DMFSFPHDISVLPNGNYTLFDNGKEYKPPYTRAVEYAIDTNIMTTELVWEYDANKEVYAKSGGSHMRLTNGNSLIGYGGQVSKPSVIEVHPDGSKAFQIDFVGDFCAPSAFKAPWKTTLFETSVDTIDFGTYEYMEIHYILKVKNNSPKLIEITSITSMTNYFYVKETFPVSILSNEEEYISVYFDASASNTGYLEDILTINSDINSDSLVQRVARQVYLFGRFEDTFAPNATIDLKDKENQPLDTFITISFDEKVRLLDNTDLNYSNVDEIITFKLNNSEGEEVDFDAVVNTDKNQIIVIPQDSLLKDTIYYIEIGNIIEDYSDNVFEGTSATFITIDTKPPVLTFTPGNGSVNIDVFTNIIISFNEPVRNINNNALTSENLDTIIIFKENDINGNDVAFTASINENKTQITIVPENQLSESSTYYLAIPGKIEDNYNNEIDTVTITFETGIIEKINKAENNSLFNIYPNPTTGSFSIDFMDCDSKNIKIYNTNGELIKYYKNISNIKFNIDISDLPDNVYLISINYLISNRNYLIKLLKSGM
ncbi:MAG: Ig-like domain-containing protein, partial [Bacteroidales bacterium]|nr:Ig-like domain-containing protein [Bacteroidales bacterium]